MGQERKKCPCGRDKPRGRGRRLCGRCTGTTVVPHEERAEMVRLYTDYRRSIHQIAAMRPYWNFGTVRRALLNEGVKLRPQGVVVEFYNELDEEALESVAERYRAGRSPAQIAAELGFSVHCVKYRLERAGVKIRDAGETQRLARLAEMEDRGRDALSPPQRKVLTCIETQLRTSRPIRPSREISTLEIVENAGVDLFAAKGALRALRRWGLVKDKRVRTGDRASLWCRTDLAVVDVLRHALSGREYSEMEETWLPAEPFREWLQTLIANERRKTMAPIYRSSDARERPDSAPDAAAQAYVANRTKMDQRRIHAVLHQQKSVTLAVADKAMTNWGETVMSTVNGKRKQVLGVEDLWPASLLKPGRRRAYERSEIAA